jgi:hypothetical protein
MMHMRPVITLALACAGLAPVQATLAETLRCGSVLIQAGDDARYVLEKCGEPTARTAINMPESAPSIFANVYHVGITRSDRWLYRRDPGQFAAVLTIGDDGRVAAIEFERFRD